MAASPEYDKEQLNHYRISYVTTDILAEGLRSVFKQEWDNRYKTTLGEWKDDPESGIYFFNGESMLNQVRNRRLLETMLNGNRSKWDCNMLFYAILDSDCIGRGISTTVKTNVDILRKFRIEEFADMRRGRLTDTDFQDAIGKMRGAFQALGLSTKQIDDVKNQTRFPTEELRLVTKKVDDLEMELPQEKQRPKILKDELKNKVSQFSILPSKPSHHVTERNREASEITKRLFDDVKNQTRFPTEELRLVTKKVDDLEMALRQEKQRPKILKDELKKKGSHFCVLPSKPSHHVTERNREASEITKRLKVLKEVNKKDLSYLYICGKPGSGKSQLAGLVAKRFFEEANEIPSAAPFVMTLNAASPDSLLWSYALMARQLKCPEHAVTNILNFKDILIEQKIACLKVLVATKIGLYTTWLLVVDNVSSMSWVHVHLPERGNEQWSNGQVLITTQDVSSVPSTNSFVNHVSISKGMDVDDCRRLLETLSGIVDCEMAKEVAKILDYQPLALASAATYVNQVRQNKSTSNFHWVDFLEKVQKGQQSTTEEFPQERKLSYPKSITLATTFAVKNAMLSDKIVDQTFTLLSLCSSQPLSLDIVNSYILKVDEQAQDQESICMRIKRCLLVLFEEDQDGACIRVHRVVHEAIKAVMKDQLERSKFHRAVNAVVTSFRHYIDVTSKDRQRLNIKHVVPHLKAFILTIESLFSVLHGNVGFVTEETRVQEYVHSYLKFGMICTDHCEFRIARKYYENALGMHLKHFSPDHTDVAIIYTHLGDIYLRLGDIELARKYQERALAIWLEKLGPDHLHVANTYSRLGHIHEQLGDIERAKEYQERALAIRLNKLDPDHTDVATAYSELGVIHLRLGDIKQAKEYQERALAIRRNRLGPDHTDVATAYSELGVIHLRLGDIKQAKEYQERALMILLKKQGPDHTDVATIYYQLGVIHRRLGDIEQAKEYQERALAIRLNKLGPDHHNVATIYYQLGVIHRRLGDIEQAKENQERAFAIRLKKLGPDHTDVATTYSELGVIHLRLDDIEQAKEYQERALAIRLKRQGLDHPDVATVYYQLGVIHLQLGDIEQAKEHQERALVIFLKKLDPNHTDVATASYQLGVIHLGLGDIEQAKEYQERALVISLKKLGPDHTDVATAYYQLGVIHLRLGDIEHAKEYQERALVILLKKLGPDHADVATTYSELGVIHLRLGDIEQAKEYQERALVILLKKLAPDHTDFATIYSELGVIHLRLGDIERAKEYQERAHAIWLKKLGPDHLHVANTYSWLGHIHEQLSDIEQAKEYQERALAIWLYRLGPYHTDVATAYSYLGLTYLRLGDRERAKEYQDRALAIMVRKLGPDHIDVACFSLGVDFSLSLTQISFRRSRRRDMVK